MNNKSNNQSLELECSLCGKILTSEKRLNRHLGNHYGDYQ